jgi:primosomal protein N' (replication factor Y)
MTLYADIIVRKFTGNLASRFTYRVPKNMEPEIKIGQLARVPLRQRKVEGVVAALSQKKPAFPVKEILSLAENSSFLTPLQLKLASFISHYFLTSLSSVIAAMVPRQRPRPKITLAKLAHAAEASKMLHKLKAPKQKIILEILLRSKRLEKNKLLKQARTTSSTLRPLVAAGMVKLVQEIKPLNVVARKSAKKSSRKIKLTRWQKKALEKIQTSKKPVLLFGVSGSGKTEIYLRAAEEALKQNKSSIILVPEIALTPQTIARFLERFPNKVAVLHSALSAAERFHEWQSIRNGSKKIVVGPRSAIFAPVKNLGLIVIDEEHDGSYKQDSNPRYHVRQVARQLAKLSAAKLILGSATPSVESFYHAKNGEYQLVELPKRIFKRPESKVFVVDMINELRSGNRSSLSALLRLALEETYQRGEQGLLFINRRGSATIVVCQDCGYTASCPNCNLPLIYHTGGKTPHSLICHHCGFEMPALLTCPVCSGPNLRYSGFGTEKIEKELKTLLPKSRILRLDRDLISGREVFDKTYQALINHQADFIIGTQMIAKGWDLPGLSLVGILSTDPGMHLPEYLSSERTFSLIVQVIGRAGRREKPGRIIVQTATPESPLLALALKQDYKTFYQKEIAVRRKFNLPPFSQIIQLVIEQKDKTLAETKTLEIQSQLAKLKDRKILEMTASPCFLEKLRGKYRYHIIIKTKGVSDRLRQFLSRLASEIIVDVDPMSLL